MKYVMCWPRGAFSLEEGMFRVQGVEAFLINSLAIRGNHIGILDGWWVKHFMETQLAFPNDKQPLNFGAPTPDFPIAEYPKLTGNIPKPASHF